MGEKAVDRALNWMMDRFFAIIQKTGLDWKFFNKLGNCFIPGQLPFAEKNLLLNCIANDLKLL